MVEVIATDEFATWFDGLTDHERKQVERAVTALEIMGVALPFPKSSQLDGKIRELRTAGPIRIAYAFDPRRNAVLLLGGDKSGVSSDAFYEWFIREAHRLFDEYLAEQETGEHDDK